MRPAAFAASGDPEFYAMIRVTEVIFYRVAASRGYSLEEASQCVVSQSGNWLTVDETHPSYPRSKNAVCLPKPAIPAPPSLLTKIKNFASAASGHIAAGMPMASDKEILRRHDICLGCEFLKNNSCMKCGCPVNRDKKFISKLSWADQECPVGKWGKEEH